MELGCEVRIFTNYIINKLCTPPKHRISRSVHNGGDNSKKTFNTYTGHEETLSGKRREFVAKLKTYSNFYSSLPVQVCHHSTVMENDTFCWNGHEIVERFNPYPVKNGLKFHASHQQEGKSKGSEPVVNQIIDKLNHINQVSLIIILLDFYRF
ncbi:hypothetical protein GDO86_015415 [Hymenochirus boettgeri]|uniref:Glypican-3 n=1 Tax=Hymenochirus boettgeri TaxID=247094 RepID=A0A8T2JXB3_9PIPI|nr:hypothetical protein GDO86_015415 [Hymenochirus boettgeri]